MNKRCNHFLGAVALASVLLVGLTSCQTSRTISRDDGIYNPYRVAKDPVFEIRSVATSKGARPMDATRERIPTRNIYVDKRKEKKEPERIREQKVSKISPILEEWVSKRRPDEKVEIIATFRDDVRIPLLPELGAGESRERGKTKRSVAIERLKQQRARSQTRTLRQLAKFGRFEPIERFWIVNSVAGTTTIGDVNRLAEAQDVLYLQPVEGGEKPPQDSNTNNDARDGRARIVSDPYYNLSLTSPWIGLLDTGVRTTHQMFNSPDHIAWMRDCVNGGTGCNDTSNPNFNTDDFAWNHGTSTAGILTGNGQLGNDYRGVTEIQTDSWQIYTAAGLHSGATLRAFQAGVAAFDKVLVGELQANESESGAIATAADAAYDAGAIVVSANGNFGPNSSTVRSPAIAHKVLGVGGFMTDGGAQYNNQGRGPATDGRFKPDIQTPTWSETASNVDSAALRVFSGTSGATPYAAAAAMLARNWLHQFGAYDAGQTYAFMILYGQNPWPYDNTQGAGRLEMATNGHAWWGKVVITNQLNCDIPITLGAGRRDFEAALWWPESVGMNHNDIDVHLIDPSGIERARGYSSASIFERTGVNGSLAQGTWIVRIRGFRVRTGSQTVYWAVAVHN